MFSLRIIRISILEKTKPNHLLSGGLLTERQKVKKDGETEITREWDRQRCYTNKGNETEGLSDGLGGRSRERKIPDKLTLKHGAGR